MAYRISDARSIRMQRCGGISPRSLRESSDTCCHRANPRRSGHRETKCSSSLSPQKKRLLVSEGHTMSFGLVGQGHTVPLLLIDRRCEGEGGGEGDARWSGDVVTHIQPPTHTHPCICVRWHSRRCLSRTGLPLSAQVCVSVCAWVSPSRR